MILLHSTLPAGTEAVSPALYMTCSTPPDLLYDIYPYSFIFLRLSIDILYQDDYFFKIYDKDNVGNKIILMNDVSEIPQSDLNENTIILYENYDENDYKSLY